MMAWPSRKRRVRLHMSDDKPSIEGFLMGREAGHYRLAQVELLEGKDRTVELPGEVFVRFERVWFFQVVG